MITRRFGFLGTVAAFIIGAGCTAETVQSGAESGSLDEGLGQNLKCGATDNDWDSTLGALTISASTDHTVILTAGNSVIKVNGHICADKAGANIALTKVNSITVNGNADGKDTVVLDFSLGLPTGKLLTTAGAITVDGKGADASSADAIILKGSKNADVLTLGQVVGDHSTTYNLALAAAVSKTPVANVVLKSLAADDDPTKPSLTFSLGLGNDTFDAAATNLTDNVAVNATLVVYGGAGNDTITGGLGNDKLYGGTGDDTFICTATFDATTGAETAQDGSDYIEGGGDPGDLVDYSTRKNALLVDLDSTKATYWGADLRGLTVATGNKVTLGVNAIASFTYASPADITLPAGGPFTTPKAIVTALNTAAASVTGTKFGLVGTRLTFTIPVSAGATKLICADSDILCDSLGLPTAGYTFSNSDIGNDGASGEADDIQLVAKVYGGAGNDVLVGNGGHAGRTSGSPAAALPGVVLTLDGKAGTNIISAGSFPTSAVTLKAPDHCPVVSSKVAPGNLVGGTGDDWFDMGTAPVCPMSLVGKGGGKDVVDFSRRTAGVKLTLDGKTLSGTLTTGVVTENDLIASDINVVLGSGYDDTIVGTASADYIFGGPGVDTITTGLGEDHIWGGPGIDYLNGEGGNDTFYELTTYQAGTRVDYAVDRAAITATKAANDPLAVLVSPTLIETKCDGTSDSGVNHQCDQYLNLGNAIYGDSPGAGNDIVNGGGSSDDGSNDKLDLTNATGAVKVILCRDTATKTQTVALVSGAVCFTGFSSDDSNASSAANVYMNVEWVAGAASQTNFVVGTANSETFEGGSAIDVLLGQGGADSIYGFQDGVSPSGEADVLCGGDGDDTIQSGTAASIEGEGQMLQSAVGTSAAADDCYNINGNGVTTATADPGVNLCIGPAATKRCL